MRVTHPFHPLTGRELVCVGERYNRYGTRLLLRVDDDTVSSVLPQWTDTVVPDPEVALGGGRGLVRVADLIGLADLVSRVVEREQQAGVRKVKDDANVNTITPQQTTKNNDQGIHSREIRDHVAPRALDDQLRSGVIDVTDSPEVPCRSDETAKTRRRQLSKKRAR